MKKDYQKYIDEIKRLNVLISKNKNDSRNNIRLAKIRTLKKIVDISKKVKSKKLSPKQYKISYKDLSKEFISYKKQYKYKGWDELWNWKNSFSRGIISAYLKEGGFNKLLGYDFTQFIEEGGYVDKQQYLEAIEILQKNKKQAYAIIEKSIGIEGTKLSFEDITTVLQNEKWKTDLSDLWYADDNPFFDFTGFRHRLKSLTKKVVNDWEATYERSNNIE